MVPWHKTARLAVGSRALETGATRGLTEGMKITVAGAGAMGCRFGAALFEAGHDVTLLDGWREHVAAINAGGLRVTDAAGTRTLPVTAVLFPGPPVPPSAPAPGASAAAVPGWPTDSARPRAGLAGPAPAAARDGGPGASAADLVIVFAKATATSAVAAAAVAAGAIGPGTLVLTLQNGLGNVETLLAHVPADRLLAGTTTLGTELLGPGHIRALGSGETVLGPVPGHWPPRASTAGVGSVGPPAEQATETGAAGDAARSNAPGAAAGRRARVTVAGPGPIAADGGPAGRNGADPVGAAERIALVLYGAGISVRTTPNALEVIWAKVAFNCVMNSLCSIASIPVSALARYDGFDVLASSVLGEVAAIAAAEGVLVDQAAALRLMRAQFDPSASGDHLASMLQDLISGRPTEIAHLNGAIAERAAARGIGAPANATISALIGLLEATWAARVSRLHPGQL